MDKEKKKLMGSLIRGVVLGGVLLVFAVFFGLGKESDGKLHVVFCDVGQGDAALIRTPTGKDILIDGGPDDKVLSCLSNHLPFWDKKIEAVFLTHPQADHLNGLISVLERYEADYFIGSAVDNETEGYKKLKELIFEKQIKVENPYLGKEIDFSDGAKLTIYWPEKKWLSQNVSHYDLAENNSNVLGAATFNGDLNEISTVMKLSFLDFDVLFPGDADEKIQPVILKDSDNLSAEILKVPHHGSRTGLDNRFLETIKPVLAVISVGKNNFGHPAKEILKRLDVLGIQTRRTDIDGEIEVISDGKRWYKR